MIDKSLQNNIGTKLCFIDSTGKLVRVVGDLYSIKLIRKITDIYWLEFPVEWETWYAFD